MLIYYRIAACICLLAGSVFSHAQSTQYSDHIGLEDGLTSQLCLKLLEDNYGNLWISSYVDFQKYDGYKVHSFPLAKIDGIDRTVSDFMNDQNNMVWVIQREEIANDHKRYFTIDGNYKIAIMNPVTHERISFTDYVESNDLAESDILRVLSANNHIYFITKDNQVYSYSTHLNLETTIRNHSGTIKISEDGHIVKMANHKIEIEDFSGNNIYTLDSLELSEFDNFSVTDYGEIFLFKKNEDKITVSKYCQNKIEDLIHIEESEFFELNAPSRHAIVKSYPSGEFLINKKFYKTAQSPPLLLKNSVRTLDIHDYVNSKTDLSYVATNLGVFVYRNKKSFFNTLATLEEAGNSVRAFFINEDLKFHKKAEHSDKRNSEVIEATSGKYDLSFLDNTYLGIMSSMHYQDPLNEDVLWSCGYLPRDLRKINFLENELTDDYKLPSRKYFINNIQRSATSKKLYLGSDAGLLVLDEDSKVINIIELGCIDSEKIEIKQIIERGTNLWLATSLGVIEYNESTNQCHKNTIFDSLSLAVQYIHLDEINESIVWLGTRKGGLLRWDTTSDSYEIFNTYNGLSNNDVHAILEDSKERLWISTNRNLNCLDKKTNHISVFTEDDGISHSEFNRSGYFEDKLTNTFYFGGLNGYTYFNPDSITTDNTLNNIELRLTEINKTKEDLSVENAIEDFLSNGRIDIVDDDISVQLVVASNHIFQNTSTQFFYRIPELYEDWKSQASNIININRLPYGRHTIELTSDINRPSLTSQLLPVELNVIRPFKKTWKAFFLALFTFLLLLWLGVQRYNKSIIDKNTKLELVVSERTQELRELNKTKSKLFAILAHDLRNPIVSLTGITEKIKFLAQNNRLSEIDLLAEQTKDKVSALDESLNNILIWALSENKLLVQKPEKLSLKLEINKINNLYSTQISEKQIESSDNLDVVDQVFLDVTVLQTILRNIISNALKFSPVKSKIEYLKSYEDAERMHLTIKDGGIGMNNDSNKIDESEKEQLAKVGKGSGLGLKIIYELAELSGVIVHVKSNSCGGTDFTLDMPKK